MELGSGEAIKQAVMANMGVSLVSKMSIEQELKNSLTGEIVRSEYTEKVQTFEDSDCTGRFCATSR